MKRFISIFIFWGIILSIFTFFSAWYFIDTEHLFRIVFIIALIFSVISYTFAELLDMINELKKRVEQLERKT